METRVPHVFLADFGLAKNTVTGSKFTRTGETVGTPAYMSPELARGDLAELTPAADVWALGCVLYELLCNRPAFEGNTSAAIIGAVLTHRAALGPGFPRPLRELTDAALESAPGDRPTDAAVFREECARVLRGRRPVHRPRRRWLWPAVAAAGVLAAVGAVVALATAGGRPPASVTADGDPAQHEAETWAAQAAAVRVSDPVRAITLLERALQRRPDRHAWRAQLGELQWSRGETAAALETWYRIPEGVAETDLSRVRIALAVFFRAVKEGDPRRVDPALLDRARQRPDRLGRLARAVRALVLDDYPAAAAGLEGLPGWDAAMVRGYLASTDLSVPPAAVVREFDTALQEGVPFLWALVNRAGAHLLAGNTAAALDDATRALAIAPDEPKALIVRATARLRMDRLPEALADAERAVRLQPKSAIFHDVLGVVRDRLDDLPGALEAFTTAIALGPLPPNARQLPGTRWYHRGLIYEQQHRPAEAQADYAETVRRNPQFAEAWERLGILAHAQGETEASLGHFTRALELEPDHAAYWFNRGTAHMALRRMAEALVDFTKAVELDPGEAGYHSNRAAALYGTGDVAGAEREFGEAVRLQPDSAMFRQNRGLMQHLLGDHAAAAATFRAALGVATDEARRTRLRGLAARCEGELSGGR